MPSATGHVCLGNPCSPAASALPPPLLAQVLQAHLELPRCMLGEDIDYSSAAASLQRFTQKQELK